MRNISRIWRLPTDATMAPNRNSPRKPARSRRVAGMVLVSALLAGSSVIYFGRADRITRGHGPLRSFRRIPGIHGDVIVPAIAEGVKRDHAAFYWHLGDFRLGSGIDEDFRLPDQATPSKESYRKLKWADFEQNQLAAFDDVPVYVAIGNHETIPPETPESVRAAFRPWLDAPVLRAQRPLADDPSAAVPQKITITGFKMGWTSLRSTIRQEISSIATN